MLKPSPFAVAIQTLKTPATGNPACCHRRCRHPPRATPGISKYCPCRRSPRYIYRAAPPSLIDLHALAAAALADEVFVGGACALEAPAAEAIAVAPVAGDDDAAAAEAVADDPLRPSPPAPLPPKPSPLRFSTPTLPPLKPLSSGLLSSPPCAVEVLVVAARRCRHRSRGQCRCRSCHACRDLPDLAILAVAPVAIAAFAPEAVDLPRLAVAAEWSPAGAGRRRHK